MGLFSHSVVSDSLQSHGLQHTRLPCPSPSPRLCSTHVHSDSDTIEPSHPLLSPSPLAFNVSHHQGLFQWVGSSHQVSNTLACGVAQQIIKLLSCHLLCTRPSHLSSPVLTITLKCKVIFVLLKKGINQGLDFTDLHKITHQIGNRSYTDFHDTMLLLTAINTRDLHFTMGFSTSVSSSSPHPT